AQLEMALTAAKLADNNTPKFVLKNLLWTRPAVVDTEGLIVHIALYPEENAELGFEIYSDSDDGESQVFSRGVLGAASEGENASYVHDLIALRGQCSHAHMDAERCYALFQQMGIHYGPTFQGLNEIFIGQERMLARISLPASAVSSADSQSYTLHPSLIDAALQACIGLLATEAEVATLMLPFSLATMQVLAPCTSTMWVLVSSKAVDNNEHTLDLDLCDETGAVCVRFGQLVFRVVTKLITNLAANLDANLAAKLTHERVKTLALNTQAMQSSISAPVPRAEEEQGEVRTEDLQEKATRYFVRLLSTTLKLPINSIDAHAQMESYGIDSVMVLDLTRKLEKVFGSLSKTLFFEYQTIATLSGYFLHNHSLEMHALLGEKAIEKQHLNRSVAAVVPAAVPAVFDHAIPAFTSQGSRYSSPSFTRRNTPQEHTDIAIIGVAGRYPQASNLEQFWTNLSQGKDSITEIPSERWDYKLYYDADREQANKTYGKWGGFIDGVDLFDPLFFNISPREAERMDPQERLFLECVYGTLEDAGYTKENITEHADVGVFVGVMYEEYQLYGAQEQVRGRNLAVLNSPASIANRISYYCNFNGPSIALDTMCSSSLTAIHLAIQSLQRGDCSVAIAGGVNVSIHPNKYLMLAQGKFISGKGRCESFGEGGEGYVPGEGVGAILLKPKAQAIADGDHIYGIIKATAVNHGGKTNGYTVPNPNAQAKVIEHALRDGGIDARSVSYIEAHGTGTSLGDPIEIAGLSKAFHAWTQDRQFCAIGSAKSNIGHCESAAGIAGVTKVLLQMKHKQIVPSLHSETLNPNIDFSASPFVVQQSLSEWKRPIITSNGIHKEYPRIAGISSFGAGGANAHVVIEEYLAPQAQVQAQAQVQQMAQTGPALVVLSARNEERLQEQIQLLMTAIVTPVNLVDLAYTLQVGREAMEERLAIIADSIDELREKLQALAKGDEHVEAVYRGQVKRNKEAMAVLLTDEDMLKAIQSWVEKAKYDKLLDLWVKGLAFDWRRLYGEEKPQRLSLPTYPFARQRYWVKSSEVHSSALSTLGTVIHPLLHRNTSDIFGLQFSTHFSGKEFFLADHVVEDVRLLPGAAQLEMAYCAARQGLRMERGFALKNIVWMHPITVDDAGLEVHIVLHPEGDGTVSYEIIDDGEDGEASVFSSGKMVATSPEMSGAIAAQDVATLRLQCTQAHLTAEQCYAKFTQAGLQYGPAFQALNELFVGTDQVLARISLPVSVQASLALYALHPSLLDAALQATLGMQVGADFDTTEMTLMLPFALGALEVFAACTSTMWAVVRYSAGSARHDPVQKLDIDLCDDAGTVCVRFKQFCLRPLVTDPTLGRDTAIGATISVTTVSTKAEIAIVIPETSAVPVVAAPPELPKFASLAPPAPSVSIPIDTLLLVPEWEVQVADITGIDPQEFSTHVVLLCGLEALDLQQDHPKAHLLNLAISGDIAHDYTFAAGVLLEQLQQLHRQPGKHLIQVIVSTQGEAQMLLGLGGMLRSAQMENARLVGQVIGVETHQQVRQAVTENRYSGANQVRYRDGHRMIVEWREQPKLSNTAPQWKDQGVYLITGGAGGLGLIFAREIAIQTRNAVLILTGRSALNETIQAQIRQLEVLGATVHYRALDVGDANAVTELVHSLAEQFESLDGIIHSAGVLRDSLIGNKTKAQLNEVFHAKVAGIVNLDQASRDMELDCFICFSSIAGALGNIGQLDYAAANAFMDAYAHYRADLTAQGSRYGHTLSINWPLWEEGGMQISASQRELMARHMGLHALLTESGLHALRQALSCAWNQLLVVSGKAERLRPMLLNGKTKTNAVAPKPDANIRTSQDGSSMPTEQN
ncbi:MAG: SDR family NAD(P)-dependent oxidoreductase, partial [Undibacterium sp.]|nr:SDR family NAD(P)-dependent oxidoreductase [Undibacterium sp.]